MEFMFSFIRHPNCTPEIDVVICCLEVLSPRGENVGVRRHKHAVKPCRQKDCKPQTDISGEHRVSVVEGVGVENWSKSRECQDKSSYSEEINMRIKRDANSYRRGTSKATQLQVGQVKIVVHQQKLGSPAGFSVTCLVSVSLKTDQHVICATKPTDLRVWKHGKDPTIHSETKETQS